MWAATWAAVTTHCGATSVAAPARPKELTAGNFSARARYCASARSCRITMAWGAAAASSTMRGRSDLMIIAVHYHADL
jgi:hypothetical protein